MNEDKLKLLNIPPNQQGVPVCVYDVGFSIKNTPYIIPVDFDENRDFKEPLHGTGVVSVIKQIANPSEIHCVVGGINKAIRYCIVKGIRLISMSVSRTLLTDEDIKLAKDNGIIIVKSAGNEGNDGVSYPTHPYFITVAAFSMMYQHIKGNSSRGWEVDISAPEGWDIKLYNGFIHKFSDTSSATPVITACLSIFLKYNPNATVDDCKEFLYGNAKDIEEIGVDIKSGNGLLVMPDLEVIKEWMKVSNQMVFKIGSKDFYFNGIREINDVAPVIINRRTMMPVRSIVERMGGKIDYTVKEDGTVDEVIITW